MMAVKMLFSKVSPWKHLYKLFQMTLWTKGERNDQNCSHLQKQCEFSLIQKEKLCEQFTGPGNEHTYHNKHTAPQNVSLLSPLRKAKPRSAEAVLNWCPEEIGPCCIPHRLLPVMVSFTTQLRVTWDSIRCCLLWVSCGRIYGGLS